MTKNDKSWKIRRPETSPWLGHSLARHLLQFFTECPNVFLTPLNVSQNNLHLFHLASSIGWRQALNWGFDLKQSCLSLFLRQEKNVSKNYSRLQGACGAELAPVPEKKLKGPALLMWIHWGCVLLRGKPSIITRSLGFCCSDDYIMSKMDVQLCNSPGETNGTPLVD